MKKLLGVLLVFSCMLLCCDYDHGEYVSVETYPADQVFRDHNSYRVRWVGEDRIDQEIRCVDWAYMCNPNRPRYRYVIEDIPKDVADKFLKLDYLDQHSVFVIRDVAEGRGYVNVLYYRNIQSAEEDNDRTFAEIHLPISTMVQAGNDRFGSHPAWMINTPMADITNNDMKGEKK